MDALFDLVDEVEDVLDVVTETGVYDTDSPTVRPERISVFPSLMVPISTDLFSVCAFGHIPETMTFT